MGSSSPRIGVKIKNIWNHHLALKKKTTVSCFHSTAGGAATASDASSGRSRAYARGACAAAGGSGGSGGSGGDRGSHRFSVIDVVQRLEEPKLMHTKGLEFNKHQPPTTCTRLVPQKNSSKWGYNYYNPYKWPKIHWYIEILPYL